MDEYSCSLNQADTDLVAISWRRHDRVVISFDQTRGRDEFSKTRYYNDVVTMSLKIVTKLWVKEPCEDFLTTYDNVTQTEDAYNTLTFNTRKHSRKFLTFFPVWAAAHCNDVFNRENCYYTVESSRPENLDSNSSFENFHTGVLWSELSEYLTYFSWGSFRKFRFDQL